MKRPPVILSGEIQNVIVPWAKTVFMRLRRRLKDFLFRVLGAPNYLSSEAYQSYARKQGCAIGKGTTFYGEKKLDLTSAPLIEIGEDCLITDGVRILVHTHDRPVLARCFDADSTPDYSKRAPVTVGDNVFIGEQTIVLPGITIGDDSIIGAGSVVASDIPSESVAAGCPCEVVCSIEEYRSRRVAAEYEDMLTVHNRYEARDKRPDERITEFFRRHPRP